MADILTSIWGKIYAWAIPSALALGAFWLLVYPQSDLYLPWFETASADEQAAVFVILAGTIAFCLSIFATPLYRVLEGYWLWPRWLQKWATYAQLRRKRRLALAARRESTIKSRAWQRGLAGEKLMLYPRNDKQVVPTRFGNAIRAFETYGKTRFNLDSQTLWNELLAVAPKHIQTEIDRARASVDFFVAAIYLSAAFCLATLFFAYRQGWPLGLLVIAAVALALASLCHRVVTFATDDWSLAVQAMVNLGRVPLAAKMGLALPDTLAEERKMWGLVTAYVFYAKKTYGTDLDSYRKKAPAEADDDGDEEDDG